MTLSQARQFVFRVDCGLGDRQMTDRENQDEGRPIVTVYVPIFREKLAKLERRGDGDKPEAIQLRRTLARIDRAAAQSSPCDGYQIRLTAAE